MQERQYRLEVQRTNLTTILVSIFVAIIGIALLYWSNVPNWWIGREAFQGLTRDLGSLIVVTVAITLIWELTAKRVFVDELLTKARISHELAASGIVQVVDEPFSINWIELFETTRDLDVFFAYGKNWRGTHESRLNKIAANTSSTIRVILPDPDNDIIVRDLANRFNKSENGIRDRIRGAKRDFSTMKTKYASSGANIEIWYTSMVPVFSMYRFDMAMVISLYSYKRHKGGVPHLVAIKGGALYDSFGEEFDALMDTTAGLSRRVE